MDESPMVAQFLETALGWMAIVGQNGRLRRLVFGHKSRAAVRQALATSGYGTARDHPWNHALAERLRAYAVGRPEHFNDIPLDLAGTTHFRQTVIAHCRRIPWGTTVSYGQLARHAGFPRAARAVGRVMATNPVPLVVPCHRVVAAQGALGGYSAAEGVPTKCRLLQLETIPTRRGQ